MRIYEFEVQEGYEWAVPEAEEDYDVFSNFDGKPRTDGWRPPKMELLKEDEGRRFLPSDMPWLGSHAPVLKERAFNALSSTLTQNGELLPLVCGEADLWIFNATTVLDALDVDHSETVRFSSGRIMKVRSYAFRPDRLRKVSAFRVPQLLPGPVFVTEEVVDRATPLKGVGFRLLWEGQLQTA